jgi:hypothetical protein
VCLKNVCWSFHTSKHPRLYKRSNIRHPSWCDMLMLAKTSSRLTGYNDGDVKEWDRLAHQTGADRTGGIRPSLSPSVLKNDAWLKLQRRMNQLFDTSYHFYISFFSSCERCTWKSSITNQQHKFWVDGRYKDPSTSPQLVTTTRRLHPSHLKLHGGQRKSSILILNCDECEQSVNLRGYIHKQICAHNRLPGILGQPDLYNS